MIVSKKFPIFWNIQPISANPLKVLYLFHESFISSHNLREHLGTLSFIRDLCNFDTVHPVTSKRWHQFHRWIVTEKIIGLKIFFFCKLNQTYLNSIYVLIWTTFVFPVLEYMLFWLICVSWMQHIVYCIVFFWFFTFQFHSCSFPSISLSTLFSLSNYVNGLVSLKYRLFHYYIRCRIH